VSFFVADQFLTDFFYYDSPTSFGTHLRVGIDGTVVETQAETRASRILFSVFAYFSRDALIAKGDIGELIMRAARIRISAHSWAKTH
jgi:hypothetical protein